MCGIVGYIGAGPVASVLMEGLRKLEYRGYDSAGLAVVRNNEIALRRASGKLVNLARLLEKEPLEGTYGIGHTRWATHGRPTEENAHPHRDCTGRIAVVHNGIIENYLELKTALQKEHHRFVTETDTEVIAHLVESLLPGRTFVEAAAAALRRLRGSFAVCLISADHPDMIIAARSGPPLIVGKGNNELLIASDVPAILEHTRNLYFMKDGDMAVLSPEGVLLQDFEANKLSFATQTISWSPEMAEKGGYRHFMLKEIFEQPRSLQETIAGRVALDSAKVCLEETGISPRTLSNIKKIFIVACGTSWHAALVGKFLIEDLARIPVEIDYGSEFRYRNPLVGPDSLVIAISQSGETADTLAAVREAKAKQAKILSICNVIGSMLSRESDGTLYIRSGPEIGVASTKAFTCQLAVLVLVALRLAETKKTLRPEQASQLISGLIRLPGRIKELLAAASCEKIAGAVRRYDNALYLGRGIHYPIALEGALKLKEISYIHAEGYPAGEMKHGPIALIDNKLPVVVLAAREPGNPRSMLRYEKMMSAIEEVRARDGIIIALASENDTRMEELSEHIIRIPDMPDELLPIAMSVPLQLLAYYTAVFRGCDVDQPRNLAKSVTVE
ncbi:MAG TPA: glutamine--fructose-6-phosphate transaminase (isomerizing) [Acidobacteriota bacterium]|nr:glutamine--fructose-6-phosphate transaminase (isomerizing) [Acidobacteriota bacterium]